MSFDDSQHTPTDYAAMGLHNASPFQWRLEPVVITPSNHPQRSPEGYEIHKADMREAMRIKRAQLAIARDVVNKAHTLAHEKKAATGQAGHAFRTV